MPSQRVPAREGRACTRHAQLYARTRSTDMPPGLHTHTHTHTLSHTYYWTIVSFFTCQVNSIPRYRLKQRLRIRRYSMGSISCSGLGHWHTAVTQPSLGIRHKNLKYPKLEAISAHRWRLLGLCSNIRFLEIWLLWILTSTGRLKTRICSPICLNPSAHAAESLFQTTSQLLVWCKVWWWWGWAMPMPSSMPVSGKLYRKDRAKEWYPAGHAAATEMCRVNTSMMTKTIYEMWTFLYMFNTVVILHLSWQHLALLLLYCTPLTTASYVSTHCNRNTKNRNTRKVAIIPRAFIMPQHVSRKTGKSQTHVTLVAKHGSFRRILQVAPFNDSDIDVLLILNARKPKDRCKEHEHLLWYLLSCTTSTATAARCGLLLYLYLDVAWSVYLCICEPCRMAEQIEYNEVPVTGERSGMCLTNHEFLA